ncbi:MAG: protein phosphatase 2C domain-containing protein [Desulfopila sp.]
MDTRELLPRRLFMYLDHTLFPPPSPQRLQTGPRVETLHEQGSGDINEDALLTASQTFGVFDGATSLDRRRFTDNRTGGRLAADIAAATFADQNANLPTLAEQANQDIARAQTAVGVELSDRHLLWSTSLAVVRLKENENRFEYCQSGDAQIVVIDEDGAHRLITPAREIDGVTLSIWKELEPPAQATIHEVLAEQIQAVRLGMNRTYGVLNGEPEAMRFLCHGSVDLTGARDILLFTDGLFLPREDPFAEHDWPLFIELYQRGGLAAIHQRVRALQHGDPHCRHYPRFKCHDDIAAVAITMQPLTQPARALA